MSKVIGNCGKHPGQNMINCPLCAIEKQRKANVLIQNIMNEPTYCLTNWGAVLLVRENKARMNVMRVSDPNCIDSGQYISKSEVKLLIRKKYC